MDAGPLPPPRTPPSAWRPPGCHAIALVFQGGGALGAYQAGVYQALHEAGLEPDWVNGVSIGSINSALIAGNPPERRLERLREFWQMITDRPVWLMSPDGDDPRRLHNMWSAWMTMALGQQGFFKPNVPPPWMRTRGAAGATSFYDSSPLRETLLRLVDFDLINAGKTRLAVGTVNVRTGNFIYYDNTETEILPEHVMASGALPPALPMVPIGTDYYWDGGLVSNTPLQHLFEHCGANNLVVFQVDLFSSRGETPRDFADVLSRQKDIQYSSRTRLMTQYFQMLHGKNVQLRALLAKVPEEKLSPAERELKEKLADLPEISLIHMIYQKAAYEGQAKDYEFSALSMREHWDAGYRDTERTLRHKTWLEIPSEEEGVVVHDVHRLEE
ncbi:MAG TPA: patatin-like phospholipase family protein [Acetobacteraceae bacterium]|jgi:NTE family protein|nr:patatin-like phospholipase family protein [Acetobacteraceae bacterium]